MDPRVYLIPEQNMDHLRQKIEKLRRRAEKLGTEPIRLKTHGFEQEEDGEGRITMFSRVTVEGKAPRLNGWRFVGKIIFLEEANVLQLLPEQEEYGNVPERFRTCNVWCDHCNLFRNRVSTYIVADEHEEYMQVGSTCLADFTGHPDPQSVLAAASIIWEAEAACQEATDLDEAWDAAFPLYVNLKMYLTYVAACIHEFGWTPRSQKDVGYPTADAAYAAMTSRKSEAQGVTIECTEADEALVKKTIAWIREVVLLRDENSDYEWNLTVAVAEKAMPTLLCGIAASAIPYYQREQERLATVGGSEYVGVIGKRTTFRDLKLLRVLSFDGAWGTRFLHRFQDPEGNVLIWWTTKALEADRVYFGKATVKDHEEYKGVKQTTLTRCKFEEGECPQPALL